MKISVVIPTRDRKSILAACLKALFRQTFPKELYEIIVVDDGSRDGIRELLEPLMVKAPCHVRYFRQERRGPAAARNTGISNACGEIVLFMGDDIIADKDLLKEHAEWHARFGGGAVAVLGFVTWAPDIRMTPFLEWMEKSGAQFGYGRIKDPMDVDYRFFYTANISLKRDDLIRLGLFDEDFPYAAYEDIELAFRLRKKGLKIVYDPKAIGYHAHTINRRDFMKRLELTGESMKIFHMKHADVEDRFEPLGRWGINNTIKLLIWYLPPFLARFVPKAYLYASYDYISYYLLRKAYDAGTGHCHHSKL